MDQKLINDLQYPAYEDCLAAGAKMQEAIAANKSMMFRPLRTMIEEDVSFLLYTW